MIQRPDVAAIFKPGQIGKMAVRNRIVMPSMGTNFATEDGYVTERLKDYHRVRARGGAGLIIVELACVDRRNGLVGNRQLCIDDDTYLSGLGELAKVIQQEGARAAIQLHHAGGATRFKVIGSQPIAPSPIRRTPFFDVPREISVDEIRHVVSCFARSAKRALEAGFDGIEIHAAHTYLISQFLSRTYNRREDEYGGTIENRVRIFLEVLGEIRGLVGKDFPVWCRINGEEAGGGVTLDDAKYIARKAEEAGVDAVHVSGDPSVRPYFSPRGWGLPLAEAVRGVVHVPVIAVGRLTVELGNEAIEKGQADFIALGRPLIADPDLPVKCASGKAEDVRPCIGCTQCLFEFIMAEKELECAVNVEVGKEDAHRLEPAVKPKKVLVVGGGPAGMEAARVAALRGHDVTIYDRNDRLGGQLLLAGNVPRKGDIAILSEYLARQVVKAGVTVVLGKEVNAALVADIRPDAVVLATGSLSFMPSIPGIRCDITASTEDVLCDHSAVGQKVIVLGGGLVGCETALYLAEKGKEVSVVEILPDIAADLNPVMRMSFLRTLKDRGVTILASTKAEEITPAGMRITGTDGVTGMIEAESVVIAAGGLPNRELAESLKDKVAELYVIGDAFEPRRIKEALSEGHDVGQRI